MMNEKTLNKALTVLDEKTLNNLPYPKFLAYNFDEQILVEVVKEKIVNQKFYNKLIEKYNAPNTILIYEGKVIYNKVKGAVVTSGIKSKINTKFDYINSKLLNSELKLKFTKNVEGEVNVVIAGVNNIYHQASYEIEKGVSVNLTETFKLKNQAKINYKLVAKVNKDASFKLNFVDTLKKNKQTNVFSHEVSVLEAGEFNMYGALVNKTHAIYETNINLIGEYAKAKVNTLQMVNKKQCQASLIHIEHLAKNTTSDIKNFGVVNDEAKLTIDGINKIEKGFNGSSANQESKIINLSLKAKSVVNPQLIINEYDVSAGHSAGVGQVDEEALYYLMSRGLNKKQATELLIMSSATDVMNELKVQSLKKVLKRIKRKLV